MCNVLNFGCKSEYSLSKKAAKIKENPPKSKQKGMEIGKQHTIASINSPFQNSLMSRVKLGEITISQLVQEKSSFNPLKRNSKLLTDYIVQHKDEFIDLLISTNDKNAQNSAIRILQCGNRRIVQAVASSPKLQEFGENLSEDSDLDRFPIIVEVCLSSFPETISDTFSFLPTLCRYATHSSINYMFEKLLQPLDCLSPIHYYLKMLGFPNFVALEAMKADDDSEKQLALLQILIFCLKCPILESCSTSSTALELIQHCVDSRNPHILALAWKLVEISVVLGENDDIYASTILDKAVSAVVDTSARVYCEYQVTALKFITKLMIIRPSTCTELNADAVIEALTKILKKYPSHSIALSAVFDFAKAGLDHPFLCSKVINGFVPAVLQVLEDKNIIRTQYAFCEKFISDLRTIARHDSILEDELTPEIQEAYRFADEYESFVYSSSGSRSSGYFNDMMDDIDLSMVRNGPIVSSQDF